MKKAGLLSHLTVVEDLGEMWVIPLVAVLLVITHATSHQQQDPMVAIQVAAKFNTRSTVFAY